jgi:hypothetical protein
VTVSPWSASKNPWSIPDIPVTIPNVDAITLVATTPPRDDPTTTGLECMKTSERVAYHVSLTT